MAKYRDKSKARSRASLVEYRRGEPYHARHERRYNTAHECRQRLQSWCEQRGLKLTVNNEGEHWIVTREGEQKHIAQWWPRTAKLIIRCRWQAGIHCHDVYQLIDEVTRAIDARETQQ